MYESRKAERAEVDEVAYLAGDGSSARCRVLSLSYHGAASELPENHHVRPQFTLMLERDRTTRVCRLIWSSCVQIGVEFPD
ncbi:MULTISPECIES: PilZ domain-containing protein [Bradyrhizobium]|uniref:PilZ domain-containing protein n=1 Tax=Bradyrhizobium TaxID=374 RepID=UPI0030B8561D